MYEIAKLSFENITTINILKCILTLFYSMSFIVEMYRNPYKNSVCFFLPLQPYQTAKNMMNIVSSCEKVLNIKVWPVSAPHFSTF